MNAIIVNDSDFFLTSLQPYLAETQVPAASLIACVDLTALNATDTSADIQALCAQAKRYSVAAVCLSPHFIAEARALWPQGKISTVANFPCGTDHLSDVLASIDASLQAGADEIDVVVPYQTFLRDGDVQAIQAFVKACKALCGPDVKLKTILESGLITDQALLERLSLAALEGGADFLKTSTGKAHLGTTLEAALVMLGALKAFGDSARGFKAAGGIKTYAQAKSYWLLAQLIMADTWPNSHCFRLGASTLLNELV